MLIIYYSSFCLSHNIDTGMGDIEAIPKTYTVLEAEACRLFEGEDKDVQNLSSSLHEVLSSVTVDAIADAAMQGIARLELELDKKNGSISYIMKHT